MSTFKPNDGPAISVRHLSQRYGKVMVVHDVSFDVQHGEIFGFIGPNGAGKTTTIRTMSTLLEPYAGRVEICGIDVAHEPTEARRLIGYMADHAGIYERITVTEYLDFFAQASNVLDQNVVEAVIELVDLGELRDRLVASLSKGMRQRLQLARVLLHDPQVLILDEPASDLDPRARIEMRDLLLELKELGKTIFLSSHILTELSDVCTSVAIIEQGRLLVAGPIGTLAEQLSAAQQGHPALQVPTSVVSEATLQQQRAVATSITAHHAAAPYATAHHAAAPHAVAPEAAAAYAVPAVNAEASLTAANPAASEGGLPPMMPDPTSEPAGLPVAPGAGYLTPGGATVPEAALRRLKLRVLGKAETVRPLLEACAPIRQITTFPGGQIALRYVADDRFVADLVRYLVFHNVALVAVEPERSELERIFLEVTRGQVQ